MSINAVDIYKFDPTGMEDNSIPFSNLITDQMNCIADKKPLPKIIFPEGVYKYLVAPTLTIPNMDWEADGYVELFYTGVGNALTFDGGPNGIFNIRFDGFRLVPNPYSADTLVLTGVHHSHFRTRILGAGSGTQVTGGAPIQTACLRASWCVCTEFEDLTITPADVQYVIAKGSIQMPGGAFPSNVTGVWLDQVNKLQTTDCTFSRPILEGLNVGININNAGNCGFEHGTIENGYTGIVISTGGYNSFRFIDMEGNSNKDVILYGNAHNNLFLVCGSDGNLNVQQGGSRNAVVHNMDFVGIAFGG